MLQFQQTAFALQLTNISVLLFHADHDSWHFGPADNRRKHRAGGIFANKSSPAHAAAVVNGDHQLCYIVHSVLGAQNHANRQSNLLARERKLLSSLNDRWFSHWGRQRLARLGCPEVVDSWILRFTTEKITLISLCLRAVLTRFQSVFHLFMNAQRTARQSKKRQ